MEKKILKWMNNATNSRSLNLKGIANFARNIGIRSQITLIIKMWLEKKKKCTLLALVCFKSNIIDVSLNT